jgi:DNA modification methylase
MSTPRTIEALDHAEGRDWAWYHGDCVPVARQLPDRSVDLVLYSPPFSSLYTYGDSDRDMGNVEDDAKFFEHYGYLVKELHRVMRPGRLCAVHCKELVNYKNRDGKAGLRDFPGELVRMHLAAGFAYHSRITIWKDPVIEMQRTKAHGLLYKQLRDDSTFSRQGMAEYVLVFRRWPENEEEEQHIVKVSHTKESFSLDQWQRWASPVWDDIRQTRVLNVEIARDDKDEKHMCPLQLDVIERACVLWSNEGETVFSPFGGIGSEGVGALRLHRKFVGVELKRRYWEVGRENLRAEGAQADMPLFAARRG